MLEQIAQEITKELGYTGRQDEVLSVLRLGLVKLASRTIKPAYWMCEYSYDLNGDKQGNWPVEMHTYVSFSRTKPDGVATEPLYTGSYVLAVQQRTVEACARVCQEETDNYYPGDQGRVVAENLAEAIRAVDLGDLL